MCKLNGSRLELFRIDDPIHLSGSVMVTLPFQTNEMPKSKYAFLIRGIALEHATRTQKPGRMSGLMPPPLC